MKPALVLVDLQNDYLGAKDLLPARGAVVEGARRLLELARRDGVPVIHVMTTVHRGVDDRMPHWKRAGRWICEAGTPGHATPEELRPLDGEAVVNKRFFSGFDAGDFEEALKKTGCGVVYLAGVHLHACVRATALDLYSRGYEVVIVEDACGSDDPVHAAITRRYLEERGFGFCKVSELVEGRGDLGGGVRIDDRPSPRNSPVRLSSLQAGVPGEGEVLFARLGEWRGLSMVERGRVVARLGGMLKAHLEELARLVVEEVGKPIAMARGEVLRSVALVEATAGRAGEEMEFRSSEVARYRYVPLGVVAIVTPWNNPIAIPVGKIAPGVVYGNGVVWKPAPASGRVSRRLMELFEEAGWPVRLVEGGAAVARALAGDGRVDGVSLSGSLLAGYGLQEICARRSIPFQGELGGNNAAIVCADADLKKAAREVAAGAFGFAGQRCTANRRVIVEDGVIEAFSRELVLATRELAWGDPWDEQTVVGPLIDVEKREAVVKLVERARAAGHRVVVPHEGVEGFEAWNGGRYLAPVIVFVGEGARVGGEEIVMEETFGPVLVVQRAGSFEVAIELLNEVRQGLVGAIFTSDLEKQRIFMEKARVGVLKLNRSTVDADAVSPLGGWKASGVGPGEHGVCDREFFCRVQTVYGGG